MGGVDDTIQPYAYPARPHRRRHGPAGYLTYESHRPWIEDEFHFRCIYCLNRKVWAPTNIWAIDHLVSQDEAPVLMARGQAASSPRSPEFRSAPGHEILSELGVRIRERERGRGLCAS